MWVWEKLSSAKWLDAWEERFRGNPNLVIHVLKGGKSVRVEVFCESEDQARSIEERFGGRVKRLRRDDWEKPVVIPPPVRIRDRFLVTQESDEGRLARLGADHPGREVISIPPEMAFGTGDHATTSTCLRLLVDIARKRDAGWSCADLGCGSGVLAIAAGKLGAGEVFACDFDPFAVAVAKRNFERNAVAGIKTRNLDVLTWKPDKDFDVVVANLFSTVLIEALPVLENVVRPGGQLVLSGILASQAWEVFEAAAASGFGFPEIVRKGKWVTARGGWLTDLVD